MVVLLWTHLLLLLNEGLLLSEDQADARTSLHRSDPTEAQAMSGAFASS